MRAEQLLVEGQLGQLEAMFPCHNQLAELGFIFHIGHCGSTLLSRALALSSAILPLREPLPLLTLSGCLYDIDQPTSLVSASQFSSLFSSVSNALSRRYDGVELSMVKANSTCNNLIAPSLVASKRRRAVGLYLPLEAYLASMMAKEALSADVRGQAVTRMKAWTLIDDARRLKLSELNPVQMMVLAWLTNLYQFTKAKKDFPNQIELLNFNDFLRRPDKKLNELSQFFCQGKESQLIVMVILKLLRNTPKIRINSLTMMLAKLVCQWRGKGMMQRFVPR